MKPINGYDTAQAFTGIIEKLPPGGYIVEILDAKESEGRNGTTLEVSFDIKEGEYTGFFARNYKSQPEDKRKWKGVNRLNIPNDAADKNFEIAIGMFKGNICAIESSNRGFTWNWDESSLKGKIVGVLFQNREWSFNGRTGWTAQCQRFVDAEIIRSGKFEIPADKPLKKEDLPTGFANVDDSALPF